MDTNEDGDRNDWGPPAGQQGLPTNEATTDVQGTNLEKQPKDDQQEQTSAPPNEVKKVQATNRKNTNANTVSKEIPQTTEPTDTHHNVQVVKRKLIISSPPAQVKKSKDVPKKDNNVTTIVINGKTCTRRNLDFSADKPKSKIPVGTKVRVGRSPGNPGPEQRQEPRQRSRSRHRDSGSGEGRETGST